MSLVVNPPEFQFTGLFYNPEWWTVTSAGGSLTEEEANILYLRKTVPDTATALESFNAGLTSTTYDLLSAATTKNLFTTQTANTNLFGSMGAGTTLKFGNQTTAQSVHVSQIDCNGTTVNNATASANGPLSVGNLQTGAAGILNLGTNVARTGAINIGGIGSTGKLNINRPLTVAYSVQPAAGEIGGREFLTSTGVTTSVTPGTVTQAIDLGSQPVGCFIYEIRYNYSVIAVITTSIGSTTATHADGSFAVSTPNVNAATNYFKNVQVYGLGTAAVQYINISSNAISTVLTMSVIRTRIG